MENNKNFEDASNHIIDMLLNSTLKQHGQKLKVEKISREQKEELENMVENLKKSVDQLSNKKKKQEE